MGSLKLREYLHKEIGISQSNDARLKKIEDSGDEELRLSMPIYSFEQFQEPCSMNSKRVKSVDLDQKEEASSQRRKQPKEKLHIETDVRQKEEEKGEKKVTT